MGTIATGISDVASNSIRVVKTTMQTSATQMSYFDATQLVLAADGWWGLALPRAGHAAARQRAAVGALCRRVEVH